MSDFRSQVRAAVEDLRADLDRRLPDLVGKILSEIEAMLIEKNEAYGNSALDPVRVFSRADVGEQIRVRIDDKISRMVRGKAAAKDLIGYVVLLRIHENRFS